MATSVTVAIFGKEKKSHSQEFIFTKPVKRQTIFKAKLFAILTAIIIFNVVVIPISLFCFLKYATIDLNAVLATLSITLSQLVFMGISIFIATFIPKIRTTTTISSIVGVFSFIIAVFVNSLAIKWLEFLSPLHFFAPKYIFKSGGYDLSLAIYATIILVASVGLSALRFINSDLSKL
ncbi:MAG: hypothetical protein ATN35_05405 [Epulopiscium sp. Nele67-Bin004]|nr:MAG: hypothetical protein ATN35_05405 [Epulopiscium sp. Nele67-Bin004]